MLDVALGYAPGLALRRKINRDSLKTSTPVMGCRALGVDARRPHFCFDRFAQRRAPAKTEQRFDQHEQRTHQQTDDIVNEGRLAMLVRYVTDKLKHPADDEQSNSSGEPGERGLCRQPLTTR